MPDTWPTASMAELITMCTSPVLIGLGIVPVPGQEESVIDLPMARHFIDLLALLDEKTSDSLTPEEKQAIDQSLHELRMAFVQVQQTADDSEPETIPTNPSPPTTEGDAPTFEIEKESGPEPETDPQAETGPEPETESEPPSDSTSDPSEDD